MYTLLTDTENSYVFVQIAYAACIPTGVCFSIGITNQLFFYGGSNDQKFHKIQNSRAHSGSRGTVRGKSSVLAAGGDISQVESFIRSVITTIAGLAGLIATGFLVYGGLIYTTSSGNPERLDGAKRTLFFSAMGLAIVIGAFVLSNIVTTLAR